MKPCIKCDRTLPLSEFYAHSQMADGHLNKCKDCSKRDAQDRYYAKFDQVQVYERKRAKFPHRRRQNARVTSRMRERFPKKYQAHNAVNNALRDGRLTRKPCQRCGSLRVHGHHDDYSKPLDVMWLCPKHHKERHRELDASVLTISPGMVPPGLGKPSQTSRVVIHHAPQNGFPFQIFGECKLCPSKNK